MVSTWKHDDFTQIIALPLRISAATASPRKQGEYCIMDPLSCAHTYLPLIHLSCEGRGGLKKKKGRKG